MSERIARGVAPDRTHVAINIRADHQVSREQSTADNARHAVGSLELRMRAVDFALEAAHAVDTPEQRRDARARVDSALTHADRAAAHAQALRESLEPSARERLDLKIEDLARRRETAQLLGEPASAPATKHDSFLRDAVVRAGPATLLDSQPRSTAAGLTATFETGVTQASSLRLGDDSLRSILESGESEESIENRISEFVKKLEDAERRALAKRFQSYRVGSGDDVAARVARLGASSRKRILDTLKEPATRSTDAPAANPARSMNVEEAIESIRVTAEAAYQQLVDLDVARERVRTIKNGVVDYGPEDGRDAIVNTLTSALQARIVHVRTMYDEQPKATLQKTRELIEAASVPVQRVRGWIQLRQANAELLSKYDHSLSEFDQLRQRVGLGLLSREPAIALAQISGEAAMHEEAHFRDLAQQLNIAASAAFTGVQVGARRFLDFSKLSQPPEETPAWQELARGILISMLGNLMGPVVSKVLTSHSKLSQAAMDYVSGSTIDSIQAMTGSIVEGALKAAESKNAIERDAQFFYEGLLLARAKCNAAVASSVSRRLEARTITAAELKQLTKDVLATDPETIAETTYHKAAHGFALLVAQRSLKVGADKVSKMDNFFGEKEQAMFGDAMGERRVIGNKRGRTGVGKLHVEVFDHGTGRAAGTQITKFEIHGMNDDMAAAVLANADHQLHKLGLPVEVHVTPPWFGRHKSAPILAVDETGTLRASTTWEAFDPEHFSAMSNGGKSRYPQATNADFYSTPTKLWAAIERDVIPKTSVTVR